MTLKRVRPSSSYHLDLPEQTREQYDGRVSSFWLEGSPLLLQLSSYIRRHGEQVSSRERLRDRVAQHAVHWDIWDAKIHPDTTIDQATGEFIDDEGLLWVHSYLGWPHLTIYTIISGPKELVQATDNWAMQSLKSLQLTAH